MFAGSNFPACLFYFGWKLIVLQLLTDCITFMVLLSPGRIFAVGMIIIMGRVSN
jgi:hypothetical protein